MAEPRSPALSDASRHWALAAGLLSLLPLLLQLPGALALLFAATALLIGASSAWRPLPAALRLLLVAAMLAAIYWQVGMRFGRDTGCAMLAAMLAIKPSELKTLRDARSLLGFALFAPFAAFLLDQGPVTMLLGLAAVIAALLCMQRLADQEGHSAAPPLRGQLRGVGRLLALGLPLALAAFWLFPRLGSPLWGVPERALARPGLSDTMSPGQWLDLMADDTPALRVQFFGRVPAPAQRYWRGPVLWDFDGSTWRAQRGNDYLPAPAVQTGANAWDYEIEVEPTDRRQLVALDLPLQAPEGTRLSADYVLHSERPLGALSRWRLRSAPPLRFESALTPAQRQRALALPPGYNPRTLALARQWRQQAGADDAAIVARALQWIRRDFAYTLETPLPGRDGVDEFLFQQKAGFCQHFSSAFVVLMRGAGIPARVVTGYAGGTRNPFGDYWVVRRMDAHAWAEVWLPQRGWVRVDPTAAVAPERIYDTLEDRLGSAAGAQGGIADWQLRDVGDWLRRGWNDLVLSFDANRQQRLLSELGIAKLEPAQLVALFAGFAALLLGWMAWLLARGERERDPLLRAWRRLGRRYARLGLGREAHEPALAWALRVHQVMEANALLSLSQRFADSRYAGADSDRASLLRDLRRHRPHTGASR
ncbi:transglutaminaseTgpA domain-containing protein [Xanthomonas sp. NCPPB 3005]|uniref:transglutaminase family protein n=1 Tax=Xanthomonas sp. NCPPB 3005 TaxID=3240913 RepID=UPI00351913F5